MIKTLFKLFLIVIAAYILLQIPFIREQAENLKATIFEKATNVTTEVERVKGKVDEAKQTVEDIKEKVGTAQKTYNELKTQVIQTQKALNDAAGKINKALDAVTGSTEEAEPAPQ